MDIAPLLGNRQAAPDTGADRARAITREVCQGDWDANQRLPVEWALRWDESGHVKINLVIGNRCAHARPPNALPAPHSRNGTLTVAQPRIDAFAPIVGRLPRLKGIEAMLIEFEGYKVCHVGIWVKARAEVSARSPAEIEGALHAQGWCRTRNVKEC